jgi:hypothetical protein
MVFFLATKKEETKVFGKGENIVYNSNTKMLDDYLGIVASNLGAEEIYNIHF